MHPKKRLLLRSIAASLCVTFVCGDLRAAPMDIVPSVTPQQLILRDPARFEAPLQFASLSEIHPGNQEAFIIHIQDAHSNFSGQENLAKALDELMKKYDVRLVLSEGGWGDCSLTPMKKIASSEVWQKVARRFLMSGELQGEEYLNLVSDRPMKIVGIEEAPLYDSGLEDYRKLSEKREEVLDYLTKTERAIEKVKSKLYPKELLDYEKTSDNFEERLKKLCVIARSTQTVIASERSKSVILNPPQAGEESMRSQRSFVAGAPQDDSK